MYFALAPLFAGIVNLVLAVFVFTLRPRTLAKRVFLFCGIAIAVWNLGAFGMMVTDSPGFAVFLTRALHMGVIFLPPLFFHLGVAVARANARRLTIAFYAFFSALAATNLTPLFVSGVRQIASGWYGVAGPAYWVFSNTMPIAGIGTIVLLVRRRKQASRVERRQLTILTIGVILLLVFGSHDLLPVLGYDRYPGTEIAIYPWGTLAAGMFGVLVAYGVLQDQMLDVRITFSRGVATIVRILFLLSTAFVFLFAAVMFVPNRSPLHVVITAMVAMGAAGLVSAFLFPRLFGPSTERLERRILGDTFEYQDQLRTQIGRLETLRDYHEAVANAIEMLTRGMRLRSYVVALLHPRTRQLRTFHTHGMSGADPADWHHDGPVLQALRSTAARQIDLRDRFHGSIADGLKPLGIDWLGRQAEHVFTVCVGGEAVGVLAIGAKTDGTSLSTIDRELLIALAAKLGDIIERVDLAEQAANAAKLEHVAMMSRGLAHDLNNLITPISSFLVHIDGHFSAGSPQAEVHAHASRSVRVMQEYVRDAMFFGKRLAPKLATVDVGKILGAVCELTAQRAAQRGLTVAATCSPDTQATADPLLLQRLITNLVNNAIDASQPDTTVRVTARCAPDGGAQIEVIDRGCGISPQNLPRVFEPYFTTKQFGDDVRGFGLGLSICRKIVDLHHGTIALESELGQGTRVVVGLPAQACSSSGTDLVRAQSTLV